MITLFIIDTIKDLEIELNIPQEERYTDTDFYYMSKDQVDSVVNRLKSTLAEEQHYADQMLEIQNIISKF